MDRLIITAFCLLTLSWHTPYQQEPEQIAWNAERPLAWTDFKGAMPFGMLFDAQSYSGIGYSYTPVRKGDRVVIEWKVEAYFDPAVSWVRIDGGSDNLLKHEQGHFDIAEIFARDLRQKLNAVNLDLGNVEYFMESYLADVLEDMRAYHDAYDRDTHHGTDQDEQKHWDTMIKKELKKRSAQHRRF